MYLKFDKIDLHIIILFSFLILFNFVNYEINNYKLVGTWSGANDSITLSIKFNDDNSCNFSIRNNSDNVSNMYMGYYEIDNSKEPNLLNIKSIPNLNHGLYTIYKFNVCIEATLGYHD